ncbi:MAG TPA: PAS domain-containing sensor histidine kinase [Candidatus Saccharimonadales bacterium]|nr:PAS domain-containing sensor histidine kinase [Candidatus Saccharimonadales bacterium]
MPASSLSPVEIWDRWLNQLRGRADDDDCETAKLDILTLLNHPEPLGDRELDALGSLLARCTSATAMVLYEEVGRVGGRTTSPIAQVKIHATTLTKSQLESCIKHHGFISHIGRRRADAALKLREPISLAKVREPINYLYRVSLGPPYTAILLGTNILPRTDQKFLQTVEATIKSRVSLANVLSALQTETDRLSMITHQLSEGLVILDQRLNVRTWNRPLQRLTGFSPLDAEHQPYRQTLRRLGATDWLEKIIKEADLNPSRNTFSEQIEIQTKSKDRRWVNLSGSFLRDETGNVTQTIILISDISRFKDLENRKNEFISIATHELRTPITAIKGYLTLLEKSASALGDKERRFLTRALQANERLVRLTEDLLQVVRVEENRVPFTLRPVNVETVITQVVADFGEKARAKNIEIVFRQPVFETMIIADQERMEQVFANLIDNAIKYTPKGRVSINFDQTTDRLTKERWVSVAVADTGIGLSAREQETIFEKFHRTNKARQTREGGTGLGLFIVKSFVEKQGGTIKVKSGFRRGSEFIISFPALEPKIERKITDGQKRAVN